MVFVEQSAEQVASMHPSWLAVADDAQVGGWIRWLQFLTLSLWDSVDAIRAFAGDNIDAAVLYPQDERYLVGGQLTVTHYQVVDLVEGPSGPGERP
jgi:hypothetical protein